MKFFLSAFCRSAAPGVILNSRLIANVIGSFRILETLTDVFGYKYSMCNMRNNLSETYSSFTTLYFTSVLLGAHMRWRVLSGLHIDFEK